MSDIFTIINVFRRKDDVCCVYMFLDVRMSTNYQRGDHSYKHAVLKH